MNSTQESLWYSAGLRALEYVPEDAGVVAFGAGRTVLQALKAFYDRGMHKNRKIICGSIGTEKYASEFGIETLRPDKFSDKLPIYIDGADQIDPNKNLIKGGLKVNLDSSFSCGGDPGKEGCMHKEKELAKRANRFVVVADSAKYAPYLGFSNYPVPIEFNPNKFIDVTMFLKNKSNIFPELRRTANGSEFETENSVDGRRCQIFDIVFDGRSYDLEQLEKELDSYDGIYSSGLFAVRKPEILIIADSGSGDVNIY
ncbi:MAG: ribose-5-phosphate isomerase A [Candidatus Aenigmarchaeota archaeon]|nr:ribose-5-phosphate isomerase A [Candidatus Aenigmarchaeota archaeon]